MGGFDGDDQQIRMRAKGVQTSFHSVMNFNPSSRSYFARRLVVDFDTEISLYIPD
jgi:hypothetical protein